jgi:hypothetical protein
MPRRPRLIAREPEVLGESRRRGTVCLLTASERTSGEQNGEQNEENQDALGRRKPNESGPLQLSDTPFFSLGAGRSQVQILSPR